MKEVAIKSIAVEEEIYIIDPGEELVERDASITPATIE